MVFGNIFKHDPGGFGSYFAMLADYFGQFFVFSTDRQVFKRNKSVEIGRLVFADVRRKQDWLRRRSIEVAEALN